MRRIARIRVNPETGLKLCPDCQTEKPLSEFPVRKTGTVYTYCKVCNGQRARDWSGLNKDRKAKTNATWHEKNRNHVQAKARDNHYKRRYGMSHEQVVEMLAKQGFRCAVCDDKVKEKDLVVDHCHETGKVRGILCNLCNISLAPLERPGWLFKANAYLERHRGGS